MHQWEYRNRVEVITSVQATALVGGGEGEYRAGDLRAGRRGCRCRCRQVNTWFGATPCCRSKEGALFAIGGDGEGGGRLRIPGVAQVRELQRRLLGKKSLENEILREALDVVQSVRAWT